MDQLNEKGLDQRIARSCCYCGSMQGLFTRDHVPAKVFLDEPYPANLMVVPSCEKCNNGKSMDEEYCACIFEMFECGYVDDDMFERPKISHIVKHRPALRKMLQGAFRFAPKKGVWVEYDQVRMCNVSVNTAKGIARYEGGFNVAEVQPRTFFMEQQSHEAISKFENVGSLRHGTYPEIGSRLLKRMIEKQESVPEWKIVQPGRFRYAVCQHRSCFEVRLVFRELVGAVVLCR